MKRTIALRGAALAAAATLLTGTPAMAGPPANGTGLTLAGPNARGAALTLAPPAVAARAVPARAVPARAVPARAVPARAVPARAVPARAVPPGPAGPPQGALQPAGCTVAGTTAVCDLWAKPGQLVLPGAAATVPIWGFASTTAAPASTPGPVLVVDQGNTVTINVHNGLTTNLSLAMPTLSGLATDRVGAAPGAVATYSFTASRPGTYLYEAGHTPDGARQTAMGLVGAFVVRAAAVGGLPTAYGDAGSAYQDEAVMVLSELDPAFNTAANPLSYDLRKFAPRYRLINGKAFPETDPVATDVGRRVLLRYVNAGLLAHPMSVLGADQSVVGQDSRPTAYPEPAVTLPLAAGQSTDAIVSLPSGADGRRFMVFESGGMLNNNGQKYGAVQAGVSPMQAFGGMLTYLDTNPTVLSGDLVGPTTTRVVAAPDPASVLTPITVTADFTDVPSGNSIVDAAEVVVDDLQVAEGTGTPFVSAAFGTAPVITGATATIPSTVLTTLTQGRHTLWVRAHDAAGNWGVVNSVTVNLAVTGAVTTGVVVAPTPTTGVGTIALTANGDDRALGGTVANAEYFIDAAGTNGTGTPLALDLPGTQISAESATIPATVIGALTEGRHTILVHTFDSEQLWGPMASADLIVDRTVPTLLAGAVIPATTNGSLGSPADPTDLRVNAGFTDPVSGGVNSPIAAAEGFLDNAGANGTGFTFLALDGTFNSATENTYALVPLTELTGLANGVHQVLVHARDAAGNWGPLTAVTFTVDRAGPTVTALVASQNPVTAAAFVLNGTATDGLSAITGAEWFEGADPGAGHATAMTVTSTGALTASLSVTISGLANGVHTLRVRAGDAAGNWGATATITVTVNRSTLIFANGFNTGNASAWSQQVGPVTVAPASAFANSPALTVTGSTLAYVVDNGPVAERTLHAQFQFAAGTFNTNGAIVDLLQARNAAGTAVAVVQYRRTGGVSQLRVGLLTSAGWRYSAWSGIATSAITVRLDWTSAAAGVATLVVNGANAGSATGNSGASTVESVALGQVAKTGTNTGSGALDAYTSNR
jgi:hypothetical protein